jgi:hypothetical protein
VTKECKQGSDDDGEGKDEGDEDSDDELLEEVNTLPTSATTPRKLM